MSPMGYSIARLRTDTASHYKGRRTILKKKAEAIVFVLNRSYVAWRGVRCGPRYRSSALPLPGPIINIKYKYIACASKWGEKMNERDIQHSQSPSQKQISRHDPRPSQSILQLAATTERGRRSRTPSLEKLGDPWAWTWTTPVSWILNHLPRVY